MKRGMGILTGDAHVGFAALGGPRGAPSHTLTPEVLGPKQLLHLLTCDLDAGFSHHQACEDTWERGEQWGAIPEAVRQRRRGKPDGVHAFKRCLPSPGSDRR